MRSGIQSPQFLILVLFILTLPLFNTARLLAVEIGVEPPARPTDRSELKAVLEWALFSPSWRTPNRTEWVTKAKRNFIFIKNDWLEDPESFAQPDQDEAFERISIVLDGEEFPAVGLDTPVLGGPMAYMSGAPELPAGPPISIMYLNAEHFQFNVDFNFGKSQITGDLAPYIERGCIYWLGLNERREASTAQIILLSEISDEAKDRCIVDAFYFIHGVVAEEGPQREIALRVLYYPSVRPGMTRESLLKLVELGVFDFMLEK